VLFRDGRWSSEMQRQGAAHAWLPEAAEPDVGDDDDDQITPMNVT